MLQKAKYRIRIKVFNTINFTKSMHYNPFVYIRSEKDILKLVTALITNTKGDQKGGDEFWTKAETLLYTALIGFIWYEAPEQEKNLNRPLPKMGLLASLRTLTICAGFIAFLPLFMQYFSRN